MNIHILQRCIADKLALPVALYRANNPKSRAVQSITSYRSGPAVRRLTCIFCDETSTSCAHWPIPRQQERWMEKHKACSDTYLQQQLTEEVQRAIGLALLWEE